MIIVNTACKDLKYDPKTGVDKNNSTSGKQIDETKELFENLRIKEEDIEVMQDKSKQELLKYFESLEEMTDEFDKEYEKSIESAGESKKDWLKAEHQKPVFAIIIRWIGFEATPTSYRVGKDYTSKLKTTPQLLDIKNLVEYQAKH